MVQILVLVARSLTETLNIIWTEDDRSGERFRDAAHCDVGKSVLSHCADTALNYCLILYVSTYCIWACDEREVGQYSYTSIYTYIQLIQLPRGNALYTLFVYILICKASYLSSWVQLGYLSNLTFYSYYCILVYFIWKEECWMVLSTRHTLPLNYTFRSIWE